MSPGKHPYISLEFAFQSLTEMMADPLNSDLCAWRISLATDRINEELEECTSVAAKRKIAKSHPQFLRNGIKFLTNPRSPEDHGSILSHLLECRCDMRSTKMKNLHSIHRDRPDGQTLVSMPVLLIDAVSMICNCISLNLSELSRNRFRSPSSTAPDGEKSWPQGQEDLLPYGLKDSLLGMEYWVAWPGLGCEVFMLASSLMQFYAPFVKEVFQSEYGTTFAFRRTFDHLEEAVKFYDTVDSLTEKTRYIFFDHPVRTIFDFYLILSDCDTKGFNDMIPSIGKVVQPILGRLTSILRPFPVEWSGTRRLLSFMNSYASADIDKQTGRYTVKIQRDERSQEELEQSVAEEAFRSMVKARRYIGCLNIQCLAGDTSAHAQLCGKCSLMRYCDQKCQKEAWNSPPHPHKRMCKVISSMKEAFGPDNWALLGTADFTYSQFQRICEERSVETETVNIIGRTIMVLQIRKKAFQEEKKKENESQKERLARAARKAVADVHKAKLLESIGKDSVTVINKDRALHSKTIGPTL